MSGRQLGPWLNWNVFVTPFATFFLAALNHNEVIAFIMDKSLDLHEGRSLAFGCLIMVYYCSCSDIFASIGFCMSSKVWTEKL